MTIRVTCLAVAVLGLAVAGCSSPTNPGQRTVSSVLVTGVAPAVGATLPFTAVAVWSDGAQENVTATALWQSSNPAILTVTPAGQVTGVSAGTASVTATYQSVTGTTPAVVTVVTCNFTVSPLSFNLPKTGGVVTINVTMTGGTPCAWDAFTDHSFMSVVSGASGVGNGSITVTMDPNPGLARQGSVIVSKRFVVLFNEAQADCVTSLTATPPGAPAIGANEIEVKVTAPPGCTWAAVLPSRLVTITNRTTGSGNGLFNIMIGPNGSGAMRLNDVTVEQLKVVVPQAVPQGTFFSYTSDSYGSYDWLAPMPPQSITASAASTSEAHFAIATQIPIGKPGQGQAYSYNLTLRAPNGQPLVPGTYLNAQGGAGAPSSLPYLNLATNSFSCQSSGLFTVHEAIYGPGPSIVRFRATFELLCAASLPPALRGEISFGY